MDSASRRSLSIGELATSVGVNRETVRYYERRGLLAPPQRSRSGYRIYAADAEQRLRFIKQAQALGFTLEEAAELMALRVSPDSTCVQVKFRAERKIADVERRIAALRSMKRTLAKIAAECAGAGPASDCPILDALERPRACRK